jgi:hypothetical protein
VALSVGGRCQLGGRRPPYGFGWTPSTPVRVNDPNDTVEVIRHDHEFIVQANFIAAFERIHSSQAIIPRAENSIVPFSILPNSSSRRRVIRVMKYALAGYIVTFQRVDRRWLGFDPIIFFYRIYLKNPTSSNLRRATSISEVVNKD